MEDEVAVLLCEKLMASADFTGAVGQRLTPLVANVDTAYPYAVYTINDATPASMDNAELFNVFVALVFERNAYVSCLALKKIVKALLRDTSFRWQGSDVTFDGESGSIVCVLRWEITGY